MTSTRISPTPLPEDAVPPGVVRLRSEPDTSNPVEGGGVPKGEVEDITSHVGDERARKQATDVVKPISVAVAAGLLGISCDTVRRLLQKGVLQRSQATNASTVTRASLSQMLSLACGFKVCVSDEIRRHGGRLTLTPDEVASVLQVHVETVRRLTRCGALGHLPDLRAICIPKTAFERFVTSSKRPALR